MRFYQLLLRLYPASFRHEYGADMAGIFERRRASANPLRRAGLWFSTIADVVITAVLVHGDIARQDLRYVARTLRRSPGFAVTAVCIVALGIGATTAAFSMTDFVLIRPLPFREPGRLVKIWEKTPGYAEMEFSPPNYRDWIGAASSFESVGMYFSEAITIIGSGEPHRFVAAAVSASILPTLGVAPHLGRLFTADEDRPGAQGTLILSYQVWQTEFGGDPGVIGRTIVGHSELNEGVYTIVGVMPQSFHFPSSNVQVWVPIRLPANFYGPDQRTNNLLEVVGRLRAGVSADRARAEMQVIAAASEKQFPKDNKNTSAAVIPLSRDVSERSRLLLVALSAAAVCVLLIACANLANLLLARALDRRRELAVRAAIGAGRDRLARQLVTESLVLAAVGGAIGIALAIAGVPLLSRLVPATLPLAEAPSVDLRVLLFAVALTAVTGLGFGVVPILRIGGGTDLEGLRETSRGGGGRREHLRAALVLTELVACVVLLVAAGLLIRALLRIQATDPGFKPDRVMTLETSLPMPQYGPVAVREAFYARVLKEVRALPGVQAAGFISFLPLSEFRGGIWPVTVKGDVDSDTEVRRATNVAAIRFVTPGFFDAMGIPIKRGRDIDAGDTRDEPFVAVVSESFARRYWPDQDPLGRPFTAGFVERIVTGVVGDVKFRGLERSSEPQVYLSSQQVQDNALLYYVPKALAARSALPPSQLAPPLRDIVRRADPRLPIVSTARLDDLVSGETASRAVQVRVLSAFGAIAFALAAVGLHGLLSCAVSQRAQEIGVRVALGARPADILAMVAGNAARLGITGIVLGVAAAYAAARGMEALLAGIAPGDVETFGAAIGLVAVVLVIGTTAPTVRALRVDPIRAIRTE